INPSLVFVDAAGPVFTITGEVFTAGLTAALVFPGQVAIPGTGLSVVNDQTITVTFNTQGVIIAPWNLELIAANGSVRFSTGAVTVDFRSGSLNPLDNLMRPRQGTQTRIDLNVFSDGHAKVQVYTMRGELVRTLLDGDIPQGTTTLFWDGKTAQGNTVASGVYVLKAQGPKLDAITKVVVVK